MREFWSSVSSAWFFFFFPFKLLDNGNGLSFILFFKSALLPGSPAQEASREAGSLGTN